MSQNPTDSTTPPEGSATENAEAQSKPTSTRVLNQVGQEVAETEGQSRSARSGEGLLPLLPSNEKVLSTLNTDGTRNWLRPKLAKGKFYYRRLVTAWGLMILFVGLPYINIGGKPSVLLNVMDREFTFFGTTFFPTDSFILLMLLLTIFFGIFLFTALFGRVWCGWACPQTVYMEFLFRPLERLIEGSPAKQRKIDREGSWRRIIKYPIFLLVSMFLAHTFLAYFVSIETLVQWVQRSPFEHPISFTIMAAISGAIMFNFGWFREQTCLVVCPYGRFQAALLDGKSLIVGYDYNRGEPRGKKRDRKNDPEGFGDCIDCKACVTVCPTGIDIRQGLQMECINCTQCIDACDDIMTKVNKPTGLIRYTSQDELQTDDKKKLRLRVLVYPALLLVVFAGFLFLLSDRGTAEITVLRNKSSRYQMMGPNDVANLFRIQIGNRTTEAQTYTITLKGLSQAKLIAPNNPLPVAALKQEVATIFVVLPKGLFLKSGAQQLTLVIKDNRGFVHEETLQLFGPRR